MIIRNLCVYYNFLIIHCDHFNSHNVSQQKFIENSRQCNESCFWTYVIVVKELRKQHRIQKMQIIVCIDIWFLINIHEISHFMIIEFNAAKFWLEQKIWRLKLPILPIKLYSYIYIIKYILRKRDDLNIQVLKHNI